MALVWAFLIVVDGKVTVSVPNDAIKAIKKRNRALQGLIPGQDQAFYPEKHQFLACMWRLVTASLVLGLFERYCT